jgi:diaminopimelate decarboxylase
LARFVAALADAGLLARLHYAVKANDHLAILRVVGGAGAGADVVSEGELRRALTAGIAPRDIVFSGVGKTAEELRTAIGLGIAQINVESAEELGMVSTVAGSMGATAPVALRVNPDVSAGTHAKITTGEARTKFGIAYGDIPALFDRAASMPGVAPVGLAVHIGSQILSLAPYRSAYTRVAELVRAIRARGHAITVVDCGGGLGIAYRDASAPDPRALAGAIATTLGGLGVRLIVEPGRWLAGPAGVLLASVILVKPNTDSRFVVLDAAMNELIRPAMYDAWHGIVPLSAIDCARPTVPSDVVGPVCESSDTFARGRLLPPLQPGARVAILDAGAYGAVMSSTYNARALAAQALIDERAPSPGWGLVRARQSVEDLWAAEVVPPWLT